jgi:hypothetical protein
MTQSQGTRFTVDPLTFVVRHRLWDGNIQDHADQGVTIDVAADVDGRETALPRFNCLAIIALTVGTYMLMMGVPNATIPSQPRGPHCPTERLIV